MTFGSYEQDNDQTNGKEPIEWVVMEVEGGDAMLLSRYVLDILAYNDGNMKTSWKNSSLRRWLNSTFYHTAFSEEEQKQIVPSVVTPEKNPTTNVDPGAETTDNVFVLSAVEASYYLPTDIVRRCRPTAYAAANGAEQFNGFCWWWTRTPGSSSRQVVCVNDDGAVGRGAYAG